MQITFDPDNADEVEAVLRLLGQEPEYAEEESEEPDDLPEEEPEGEPETADCIHRTTDVDDVCLQCGEYTGESTVVQAAEDFRDGHTPVREFSPIEVPWRHWRVAHDLFTHRRPSTAAAIARRLKLPLYATQASSGRDVPCVQTTLQYLRIHELAECEGRRWSASARLRAHGVVAA